MTDTYQALTPAQAEERMRRIAHRLLAVIEEQSVVGQELAAAKAEYAEQFHKAHLLSMADHPQRKVGEHKSVAEMAAMDAYRAMVIAEERDKSLRHEAHSLRQVLSSLQTNARSMGWVS